MSIRAQMEVEYEMAEAVALDQHIFLSDVMVGRI